MRGFKFDHDMAIGRWLGGRLADAVRESGLMGRLDAVTYVPMTHRDRRRRGFNQAQMLARAITRATQLPLMSTLTKSRPTELQAGLPAQDRRINLQGAFRPVPCSYGRVLLVDDIYTTGSTVEECARTLKRGGVESVVAITVARA